MARILAVRGPAERAHPRRIAGHAHVLGVGEPPAVQHRLLHGGDEEFAVRAEGDAEMRALPFELLGCALARWETRAWRRCSARSRAAGPWARRQARDGRGRVEACAPRLSSGARRRSCPPTRRPRRRGRARRDRSSGSSRRWRATLCSPALSVAITWPSSPPVTMRLPSAALDKNAAGMDGDALLGALAAQTAAPPRRARTPALARGSARRRPCAPASTARTRSASEGMGVWMSASCALSPPSSRRRARHARVIERWGGRCLRPACDHSSRRGRSNSSVSGKCLRRAGLKALADFVFRQIAADEDDAAFALLVLAPRRADGRRRGSCARPGTRSARDRP